MRGRHWTILVFLGTAVLALAATPASATVITTSSGATYLGSFTSEPLGSAVFHTPQGDVTCDEGDFSGTIETAETSGYAALGEVTAFDLNSAGGQACPDSVGAGQPTDPTHQDLAFQASPLTIHFNWLSDNTSGARNGTVSMESTTVFVDFDLPMTDCTFQADFNNSGGFVDLLAGDVYNPENSASGHLEVRFDLAPFESADPGYCAMLTPASLTAHWALQGGAGSGELHIRRGAQTPCPKCVPIPPVPPYLDLPMPALHLPKCKKPKKKRGSAAIKRCRKRK